MNKIQQQSYKNEIIRLNQEINYLYWERKTLQEKLTEVEIEKSTAIKIWSIQRKQIDILEELIDALDCTNNNTTNNKFQIAFFIWILIAYIISLYFLI